MGLGIIALVFGLYVFVLVKSFYFTKPSEIVSVTYFETLKLNARIILVVSLLVLFVALAIHGGVYWGVALFTSLFSFLGFIIPTSVDNLVEVYLEQVAFIGVVVLMPYAKYSLSVTRKFKTLLFDYYLNKHNSNIEILEIQKGKSFSAINNIVFANKVFLNKVRENLADANVRNSSISNVDDAFYFPDKKIYIIESKIEIIEEVYKVDNKGKGKWKTTDVETLFNGLIIVLPKEEYSPNAVSRATIFTVENSSSSLLSSENRADKKHGFILDLYYNYFRGPQKNTYDNNNFSDETYENFSRELKEYSSQNPKLYEIARKMNVEYVMEDDSYVYIFHNEKNIDLFTFYQNQEVAVSLKTFEEDFELLLKISKEFNL